EPHRRFPGKRERHRQHEAEQKAQAGTPRRQALIRDGGARLFFRDVGLDRGHDPQRRVTQFVSAALNRVSINSSTFLRMSTSAGSTPACCSASPAARIESARGLAIGPWGGLVG